MHLALLAGGLSDIKLQQLVSTLRNGAIHKCDVYEICNELEINIKLISLKHDSVESRVEHYPMHPHKEDDETYEICLMRGHCFINYYTELTSYCLEIMKKLKA